MAAEPNVEEILGIDSPLSIPPGFSHGLQLAIPQSAASSAEDTTGPGSDYLQQQQQEQQQQQQQQQLTSTRKGNSLCSWFRRKLWCIRGNSPVEPQLRDDSSQGGLRRGLSGRGSLTRDIDLKKSVHDLGNRTGAQTAATANAANKSGAGSNGCGSEESVSGGCKTQPKDRQVTFSDTVRTHIKTKYVTAEEYKQIRGMNAASGRIMYQISKVPEGDDQHPRDKISTLSGNAIRCKRRKP